MSLLRFRVASGALTEKRSKAVRFVEALAARDFAAAAKTLGENISWFGEVMTPESWASRAEAALGSASMQVRLTTVVLGDTLCQLPAEVCAAALGGAVDASHALSLFDFRRDEAWVSLGVLCSGDGAIERIVDLYRLKRALLPAT